MGPQILHGQFYKIFDIEFVINNTLIVNKGKFITEYSSLNTMHSVNKEKIASYFNYNASVRIRLSKNFLLEYLEEEIISVD